MSIGPEGHPSIPEEVSAEGQFNFHAPQYPKDFGPHYTFLPTYFGNMKILPSKPQGEESYPRPDH
jgi:hypothetical protein